jgi:hypothetical protein
MIIMPLRVRIIRHWTVSELIFEVTVLSLLARKMVLRDTAMSRGSVVTPSISCNWGSGRTRRPEQWDEMEDRNRLQSFVTVWD